MNLSLIFIIWFGNIQTVAGTTNVGDVVAIVNYALRTVMAISMFTFISLAFSRAKASAERLDIILSEQTPTKNTIAEVERNLSNRKVSFKHITFSYLGENVPILEDITFTVSENERIAIMGATGSGKTSLFQVLPRLYEPDKGEIYIGDQPISTYELEELRNNIGYVPQNPLLYTGTIANNIRFGKEDATEEEVIQAAKDAQIHET